MPLKYCHRVAESKYKLNLLIGTYSFTANNFVYWHQKCVIFENKEKAQDTKYFGTKKKEEK